MPYPHQLYLDRVALDASYALRVRAERAAQLKADALATSPTSGALKRAARRAYQTLTGVWPNNEGNYPGKRTPRPEPDLRRTPRERFAALCSMFAAQHRGYVGWHRGFSLPQKPREPQTRRHYIYGLVPGAFLTAAGLSSGVNAPTKSEARASIKRGLRIPSTRGMHLVLAS